MADLGVFSQEMKPIQPIQAVRTGITGALVDTKRGIPNKPFAANSFNQYLKEFGYFVSGKYSHYCVRGAFNNLTRTVQAVRVVGSGSKKAAGGNGYKFGPSKALVTIGAGASAITVVSKFAGVAGLEYSVVAVANSSDKTEVTSSGKLITLKTADTNNFKRSAKVCSTVLNGHAHFVAGAAATSGVVFYAKTAGANGNLLEVEIVDTGGAGPATFVFSPDGKTLTIDLVGVAVTSADAAIGVNALAGNILAYEAGDGLGNIAVLAKTSLAGGNNTTGSLIEAIYGGTGLGDVTTFIRTYLEGVGSVTISGTTITDTSPASVLTLNYVDNKVMPGNILVVYNGPDKGAYEVTRIDKTTMSVTPVSGSSWAGWSATQSNLIYSVFGTNASYNGINYMTHSTGDGGDDIYVEMSKVRNLSKVNLDVKVRDDDGSIYTLDSFTNLGVDETSSDFVESVVNSDSQWGELSLYFYKTVCTITAASSTVGVNTLTKAGATFVADGVEVGDYCVITSATTATDVKVVTVVEVTSNTVIKVSENFAGTQADVAFTVLKKDTTGEELLNYLVTGTKTVTLAGGVFVTPIVTDYQGSEAQKTGIYAFSLIPREFYPNKFMVPEALNVLDSVGADATSVLDGSMATFASNDKRLVYGRFLPYGLTPNQVVTLITNENLSNDYLATWWNFGKVSDPVSGTQIWCPLVGHCLGLIDAMDSGAKGEGLHQAPANAILEDVSDLEYFANEVDASLLSEVRVNAIIKNQGIRPYGDYIQTATISNIYLHKRLVTIKIVRSVVESLATWLPWSVQSRSTWSRIRMAIDTFSSREDRRKHQYGALENYRDASQQPWYVICDDTNNDASTTVVNIEHAFDVVNTIETVRYRYGFEMSSGSVSVEQI